MHKSRKIMKADATSELCSQASECCAKKWSETNRNVVWAEREENGT